MPHVDEGRLHAYLDGALHAEDPGEARAVERHVEDCADCRALLEEARQIRDEATALLGAAAPPRVASPPPWEEVLHRAGAAEPRPRGIAWLPAGQRLAWAASLVIALGVGWWAHAALGAGPFAPGFGTARVDDASTASELVVPASTQAEDGEEEAGGGGSARGELEASRDDPRAASDDAGRGSTSLDGLQPSPAERVRLRTDQRGVQSASPDAEAPAFRSGAAGERVFSDESDELAERDGAAKAAQDGVATEATESRRAVDQARGNDDARLAGEPVESFERDAAQSPPSATPPPAATDASEARAREPARAGAEAESLDLARPAPPARAVAPGDAGDWDPVTLEEAATLLGATPVGVPGAETLEVAWAPSGRTLRVAQRLESGERIDLYQWLAGGRAGARAEAENQALAEVGALRGAAFDGDDGRTALVETGGLLVAASAPLSAAALRDALDRLEPLSDE